MNIGLSDNLTRYNFDKRIENNDVSSINKVENSNSEIGSSDVGLQESKETFSNSRLGEYNLFGTLAKAKLENAPVVKTSASIEGNTKISKTTTQQTNNNASQKVTKEQLEELSPRFKKELSSEEKAVVVGQINLTIENAGIKEPRDKAIFLSQVATETGGFTTFTELPSKFASSKNFYKGRGPLQLTGESNYRNFAENLGGVKIPERGSPIFLEPIPGTDRSKLIKEIKTFTNDKIDAKPKLDRLDRAKEKYVDVDKDLNKAVNNLTEEQSNLQQVNKQVIKEAKQNIVDSEKVLKEARQEKLKARTPEEIANANKGIEIANQQLKSAINNSKNITKDPPKVIKEAQERVTVAKGSLNNLKQQRTDALNELKEANKDWTNVILNNPQLLAKSDYVGAMSGVYYWKENKINTILNNNRDNEAEALKKVSAKINTGSENKPSSSINGFEERKNYYEKAKGIFGVK